MPALNDQSASLRPEELARYSRHVILPHVGLEGQEKLAASRILVIGMGGLGSPVALYLAAAGVGTIGLADFDLIEEHNLQRQIIHRSNRIGTSKIDSALEALAGLNPHPKLRTHRKGITIENVLDLFSEYDIIVDGTDNFPTRYLVNDASFLAGKPLVYGSIFQFEGQVSLFHSMAGGPCYRCLFPTMPAPGSVPNCAEAGVFGALCGVIGSMQAMEAIKYAIGIGEPLLGRLLITDALSMQFRTLNLKKDPQCPLCGVSPTISRLEEQNYDFECAPATEHESRVEEDGGIPMELNVEDGKVLLDSNPAALFLDVREPWEVAICAIEGSRKIPMGEIPEHLSNLPRDRPILIYCHHGIRSLRVARFLRSKGFLKVSSMAGGINAWADRFDPAMVRY